MNNHTSVTGLCLLLALASCDGGTDDTQLPVIPVARQPSQPPGIWSNYQSCSEYPGAAVSTADLAVLPGGMWHGKITNETRQETDHLDVLVTEDGRFWFFIDYDEFVGTLATDGNAFAGSGVANSGGSLWTDGSLRSDLAISGTIAERESMAGDWSLASGDAGCFESFYDADLYERPVTLAQMAGNWSTIDGWGLFYLTLTVDTDGHFTFYDPWDCSHSGSGQIALIDDRYNLFEVQDLVPDCPASATPFSGFAYMNSYLPDGTGEPINSIVLAIEDDTRSFRIGFYD